MDRKWLIRTERNLIKELMDFFSHPSYFSCST
jgi:hypothetical protein